MNKMKQIVIVTYFQYLKDQCLDRNIYKYHNVKNSKDILQNQNLIKYHYQIEWQRQQVLINKNLKLALRSNINYMGLKQKETRMMEMMINFH